MKAEMDLKIDMSHMSDTQLQQAAQIHLNCVQLQADMCETHSPVQLNSMVTDTPICLCLVLWNTHNDNTGF